MKLEAVVTNVYIGESSGSLVTEPKNEIEFDLEGIVGDLHRGFKRKLDVRDRELLGDKSLEKGDKVRNWRQWSAVSGEELLKISWILGIKGVLEASLLGANLRFAGIKDFSNLPRGTTIKFPEQTILMVEEQNQPCINPGQEIAKVYQDANPSQFVKAAYGRRGLVGVVYRPGIVRNWDMAEINVYEPKSYYI